MRRPVFALKGGRTQPERDRPHLARFRAQAALAIKLRAIHRAILRGKEPASGEAEWVRDIVRTQLSSSCAAKLLLAAHHHSRD
jgi:hypothetical protein